MSTSNCTNNERVKVHVAQRHQTGIRTTKERVYPVCEPGIKYPKQTTYQEAPLNYSRFIFSLCRPCAKTFPRLCSWTGNLGALKYSTSGLPRRNATTALWEISCSWLWSWLIISWTKIRLPWMKLAVHCLMSELNSNLHVCIWKERCDPSCI